MAIIRVELNLNGTPNEGKTVTLGGYGFVDGKIILTMCERDMQNAVRYLQKRWQVNAVLAEEVKEKQAETEQEETQNELVNEAEKHAHNRLMTALGNLDPKDDTHWTKAGEPALAAVELFLGSSDITRADIVAAAPTFKRKVEG